MLWFERLYATLHLPFYVGVPLFGALIPTLLSVARVYVETGVIPTDLQSLRLYIGWTAIVIASQVASRHICRRMSKLDAYVQLMKPDGGPTEVGLLGSIWGASWVYFLFFLWLWFGSGYTGILVGTALVSVVPFLATFLWVFIAAFYLLIRTAKLPLRLKSFIEDPTMGVRPLVTESLRFVTLYEALLLGVFIYPVVIRYQCGCSSAPDIFYEALFTCAFLTGLIMFLLPLSSLHSRLRSLKRDETAWINSQYSVLFRKLKLNDESVFDEKTSMALIAVDKVRRDIRQIREWPIDGGIVAKIVTALGLPIIVQVVVVLITHLVSI